MPSRSPLTSVGWGLVLVAAISASPILWAQDTSTQLSPRELFYREQAPAKGQHTSAAPAKGQPVVKTSTPPGAVTAATTGPGGGNIPKPPVAPSETSTTTKTNPEVSHLGLRYSLLLVDRTSNQANPVKSDQTFDQGQCFALEFQANHAGYLYVFNQGSSGAWKALLPTVQMPEEGNFLPAFTSLRIPSAHCYRIAGPAGEEHMFVVLSRNPQDVDALNKSIRDEHGGGAQPSSPGAAGGDVTTLANNLNQAIQKIANLKGRDLEVEDVGDAKNLAENSAENSAAVYVVHTSDAPSDKVVTELKIAHR